eukprot:GHVR01032622.1.p1 GENE.GHVR01032622.1~~GHVR01032622.1.p1  ORF type:complete len:290 (+),score=55.88 GHVR01032622.1:305-1174(+)
MIISTVNNPITEDDIGGLLSTREIVKEAIIEPIIRPDLHVGLLKAARGILMFGPPGCGKTMLARWIASESSATFFNVTSASLTSKFFGESEKLLRALWCVAEARAPSVVFIDELDGLVGQRTMKEEDTTIRMKNELLQLMDGVSSDPMKPVVVVGATNRPFMIDEAARRRLNKRVYVPLPDTPSRKQQIRRLLVKHGELGLTESELDSISNKTKLFNGSDLINLCQLAAAHVSREAKREYGGMLNIPRGYKFRSVSETDISIALAAVSSSVNPESLQEFENFQKQYGAS